MSQTIQATATVDDPVAIAASAAQGEGKRDYVQQMFSDIAPRYDLLTHVLSLNIDRAWRRRALRSPMARALQPQRLALCSHGSLPPL